MRTPDAPVGVMIEQEGLYLLEYGDADCKTHSGNLPPGNHIITLNFPPANLPADAPQSGTMYSECQLPGVAPVQLAGDFTADLPRLKARAFNPPGPSVSCSAGVEGCSGSAASSSASTPRGRPPAALAW